MKHDFKKYLNPVFIETGSLQGKGIQSARDAGFAKIISIELSEKYYRYCRKRFENKKEVFIYHGDSVDLLAGILKDINDRCTFWLDGHFSGGETARGKHPVPLMQELLIIKDHHIKNHTILIDDMRLLRSRTGDYADLDYTDKDIEKMLLSINFSYNLHYEYGVVDNDILIAEI